MKSDLEIVGQSLSFLIKSSEKKPILRDITILIPTLGRPILERCLVNIISSSHWPGELIVVDQGAVAEISDWMAELQSVGIQAHYVPSSQRGRAAGLNQGLERVRTRFVAITDDDCYVDGAWLLNMATHLRENPETIITGRVESAGDETIIVVTSETPALYRHPRIKFDSMSGGNMGVSIAVVKKVGLFEEDPCMMTAEDAEWSYRALRKGVPILYTPDVCVQHYGWRDSEKRYEQYRNYAISHGGFYGKYIRRGDLFILLRAIVHHYRALRRWWRGIVKRDPEMAMMGKAYFTGLLPGVKKGFQSQIRSRKSA